MDNDNIKLQEHQQHHLRPKKNFNRDYSAWTSFPLGFAASAGGSIRRLSELRSKSIAISTWRCCCRLTSRRRRREGCHSRGLGSYGAQNAVHPGYARVQQRAVT